MMQWFIPSPFQGGKTSLSYYALCHVKSIWTVWDELHRAPRCCIKAAHVSGLDSNGTISYYYCTTSFNDPLQLYSVRAGAYTAMAELVVMAL